MADITEADLEENERTELLLEDAIERGLIERSDSARLRFFALAEHAKRCGTRNRPGLFRTLVTKKLWFISLEDEERARRRLARVAAPREAAAGNKPVTLGEVLSSVLGGLKQH